MTTDTKTKARAAELAETLMGSCDWLESHASEAELDDLELLEEIDALALRCDICGWWDEADECDTSTGDVICAQCSEEADG